jgi:hypothetical protein
MGNDRLYYIDNLRIFLISLVVLHHLNITYGGPGDWYYNESQAQMPALMIQAMFNITNQSFFMGMFFMISAYFAAGSVLRKTSGKFIKDRLIRLGIPLILFYFILQPLTVWINYFFIRGDDVSLWDFIFKYRVWGFGPMWFVEALLIFTFIFLIIRKAGFKVQIRFPATKVILAVAMVTGLIQFLIRLKFQVGWSIPHTNLQLPFFFQYIVLFVAGIIAYQNNWLDSIDFRLGKRWFIFAQIMILIILPILLYFGGKKNGLDPFLGGSTWQSFGWAIWEQVTGFALIIGLLGLAKKYANHQGKLAKALSDGAFAVFVFHAPVIVGISALFIGFKIPQLLKFVIIAPLAIIVCFVLAWLVKQIPVFRRIF